MQLKFKRGKQLDLSFPQIMGILNVTPDSFSDGGEHLNRAAAIDHCARMISEGATIIDIGGESTRPQAATVSSEEECERVLPVVEDICKRFDTIISLDTSNPELMRLGIEAGAHLINDVRSLQRPGALKAAVELEVPVCLMHMQGQPQDMQENPHYQDCVREVKDFLLKRATECEQAGISRSNIILDPGFCFGKSVQDNYALLKHLPEFAALPYPLLTGLSRKSMLGAVSALADPKERVCISAGAALLCAERGASIVRVHDVRETAQLLSLLRALREA